MQRLSRRLRGRASERVTHLSRFNTTTAAAAESFNNSISFFSFFQETLAGVSSVRTCSQLRRWKDEFARFRSSLEKRSVKPNLNVSCLPQILSTTTTGYSAHSRRTYVLDRLFTYLVRSARSKKWQMQMAGRRVKSLSERCEIQIVLRPASSSFSVYSI